MAMSSRAAAGEEAASANLKILKKPRRLARLSSKNGEPCRKSRGEVPNRVFTIHSIENDFKERVDPLLFLFLRRQCFPEGCASGGWIGVPVTPQPDG